MYMYETVIFQYVVKKGLETYKEYVVTALMK